MAQRQEPFTVADNARWVRLHVLGHRRDIWSFISKLARRQDLRLPTAVRTAFAGKSTCA